MKVQLLELHLSQLFCTWAKSKLNHYSDINKEAYHKGLHDLIKLIAKEDFNTLSDPELEIRKSIIDFVFKGLEFLDKSTLNTFPLEIVECLNVALKDWCDKDEYIIVTSLKNDLYSFSFEQSLAFDDPLILIIKTKYGIEFNKRLIQINLPKSFAKDYFANVALYHELGHFIDLNYKISNALVYYVFDFLKKGLFKSDELSQIYYYFPAFLDTTISENEKMLTVYNHLGEYFSDVFAAQYIGKCSNYYIDYITCSSKTSCPTHPSTLNRIKLVEDFIVSKPNYIIDLLNYATTTITTNKILNIRFLKIHSKDFFQLLPIEITNKNQLSALFILGWETWLNYKLEFEKHNNMSFELKPSKRYEIINNLIEKSISNFIINENWIKS